MPPIPTTLFVPPEDHKNKKTTPVSWFYLSNISVTGDPIILGSSIIYIELKWEKLA
jgi:hypothetical protein